MRRRSPGSRRSARASRCIRSAYLAGGPGAGPPLRTLVDSGIHVGAGSDSAQISTLDPWLLIYYMVTGKNSSGVLINAGQQLTRAEALRLYTAANGWFLREEDKLGTIEPGKLGDVVVLSEDYFDPAKVPDEAIKRLKSVLTVVDGRVVHDETKPAAERRSGFTPANRLRRTAVAQQRLVSRSCRQRGPLREAAGGLSFSSRSRSRNATDPRAGRPPSHRPAAPAPASRGHWWRIAIVLVAGILTYANSLSGPFILDDQSTIADNQQIREWWSPSSVLVPETDTAIAGRPIVNLSFAVNYAIGGLDVRGYHAGNIAIHLICALLAFGVMRRTLELPRMRDRFGGSSANLACAVALLWVVHPLNSEVVDYLTERTESLMALFYLLTLYASIRAISVPGWAILAASYKPGQQDPATSAAGPTRLAHRARERSAGRTAAGTQWPSWRAASAWRARNRWSPRRSSSLCTIGCSCSIRSGTRSGRGAVCTPGWPRRGSCSAR